MEEEESGSGRGMRLRSSVKRRTNYCEESSEESSSEEEEESGSGGSPRSPEVTVLFTSSDDEEDLKRTSSSNNNKPSSKLWKGRKKKGSKQEDGGGGGKKKKNKYKKARTSGGGSAITPPPPKSRSIASYFGGKSPPSKEQKEREERKRRIDPETRAFLASGVPEVVIRAQKAVDKRKEDDDLHSSLVLFPKISQVCSKEDPADSVVLLHVDHLKNLPFQVKATLTEEEDGPATSNPYFSQVLALQPKMRRKKRHPPLCCSPAALTSPVLKLETMETVEVLEVLPWIDKYKVQNLKSLVGDKSALNKLNKWLKQWKCDIKDDGGTSRKLAEKKRRRREEDSDFVTSEEEDVEFKNKSLLLAGPSGSGKTAAVYVIAKHFGFHVVEVNFSSRRSGKEVLQRVEEAVLSHRLESSQNCLLLFKDIELLDAEEDEGFHAAVAQLITTAVRPIVMTTGQGAYDNLDSKIEKKDPLRISFNYPKSSRIVDKILLPIIQMEGLDSPHTPAELTSLLSSITRHARSDIRQVINQAQFLFSSRNSVSYESVHQHSVGGSNLFFDLRFVRPNKEEGKNVFESEDEEDLCFTAKGRRRMEMEGLEKTAEVLSSLCDLDCMEGWIGGSAKHLLRNDEDLISSVHHDEHDVRNGRAELKTKYFHPHFLALLSRNFGWDKKGLSLMRRLTYERDEDVEKTDRVGRLRDQIGDYCDVYGEGSWDSAAYLRTIVKQNVMDSVGRLAKRNGRMTSYFNRLDRGFVENITHTFGFDEELEIAKSFLVNPSS